MKTKSFIFLVAVATTTALSACSKDNNNGNVGGGGTACYTCTIITSGPNVAPRTETSSFCGATAEYVRNFEQRGTTTTSSGIAQTTTCVKQ
jgi:hypothetical protein